MERGLDWGPGDEIYLAPTNLQWTHSEYRKIVSYDEVTGLATLDDDLDFFHFGDNDSTKEDFSGLEMRGEVRLLSRNIKIQGEDRDGWGCTVLNNGRMEGDGTFRQGEMVLDNVEIFNCSQANTYKAALRFEQLT